MGSRAWVIGVLLLTTGSVTSSCRSCNEIGCFTGVSIDVMVDSAPASALPLRVEVCAENACRETVVGAVWQGDGARPGPILADLHLDGEGERTVTVTVTVRAASDAQSLSMAHGDVLLRRMQPNGRGCPDTCFHGRGRVAAGSTEVEPAS